MGNRMGGGNDQRYNHRRTFETFPFPRGLEPNRPEPEKRATGGGVAIAALAEELDARRRQVLFPSKSGAWIPGEGDPGCPSPPAPGTSSYPERFVPDPTYAGQTNRLHLAGLYSNREAWLIDIHSRLDSAVAQAYGWSGDLSEEQILDELISINLSRSGESVDTSTHEEDSEHSDDE
jgi:hypothetical protein